MKYMYSQSNLSQLNIRASSLISNPSTSRGFLSSCTQNGDVHLGKGSDATVATLQLKDLLICMYIYIYI